MSRTHLDEIVEEAMQHPSVAYWSEHAKNTFKKIADLSFRHGVERGVATAPYMMDGRSYIVQPAPAHPAGASASGAAGEKHFCCTIIGEKPCFCHCHPLAPNRRKGQRRKGLESRQVYSQGIMLVGIYQFNSNMFWLDDRRSGKDRRKA